MQAIANKTIQELPIIDWQDASLNVRCFIRICDTFFSKHTY